MIIEIDAADADAPVVLEPLHGRVHVCQEACVSASDSATL